MEVAKRQEREKTPKIEQKEGLKTRVKTSSRTNSTPG